MAEALEAVLERSRSLGFLGPGSITDQLAHARAFLGAIDASGVARAVDLGSGGGVPGLVLAAALPDVEWILLDGMVRRTTFLREAVADLALPNVTVLTARAEPTGRSASWRTSFDLVVARGFGPPAVTAECAAPLLRATGQLVVSEPPGSAGERWPANGVALLGLTVEQVVAGPPGFVRLRRVGPVEERYPRRTGIPVKRPLWS
jgi:16S rRNA (guanine527-N7)-methyltransferase